MARGDAARAARRLALLLEYDGAAYSGSQFQKNAPSIQGELEKALARLLGEVTRVKLAGRTDAGVHAKGQVASFLAYAPYPTETFVRGLNYYLTSDIAVKAAAQVPLAFDARRHARSRLYRYTVYNGWQRSPLAERYSWHVPAPLDVAAMQEAAGGLPGRRDFASFAPATERRTERTVLRADVGRSGELVFFEIEADAFLPQQVRRTEGALVQVGLGRQPLAEFHRLVEEPKAGSAGPTAPPQGLCLMRVRYQGVEFGHGTEEDCANL